MPTPKGRAGQQAYKELRCPVYTYDAADDLTRVDLGGRRMCIKRKQIYYHPPCRFDTYTLSTDPLFIYHVVAIIRYTTLVTHTY